MILDQNPHNKSIMIGLLGRPNAGKSSLINYLLGFDLSIVSNKPQTTRNNFHCTFTIDKTEIVLVDTPGVHHSNKEINLRMNGQANFACYGSDLNFLLLDVSKNYMKEVDMFLQGFEEELKKTWIIFTKSDLSKYSYDDYQAAFNEVQEKIPQAEKFYAISTKTGESMHLLTGDICDEATPGPHMYPKGDVSNRNERFFVSEYIREQAFNLLNEELPYEMAVVIEEYSDYFKKEDKSRSSKISASILVNRPSQRAIVVGSKGSMIKKIGTNARTKIEAMTGGRVQLNLHVKVSPGWFKNNFVLEELGLPRVKNSARVWRKK